MKEILVIDIDANELPEDAYANVYVFGKYGEQEDDFVACKVDVPLKPMPQEQGIYEIGIDEEDTNAKQQWNKGWNACLEEILGKNRMNIVAGDKRFEIITKAKEDLIRSTNIETSEDEMKVLDSFLFRFWQMGWLDRYEEKQNESAKTVSIHKFRRTE